MLTVQLRIPTFPAVQLRPKRKSKVIHLGTVHELVLKYIEDLKSDNEQGMNNYLNTTIWFMKSHEYE